MNRITILLIILATHLNISYASLPVTDTLELKEDVLQTKEIREYHSSLLNIGIDIKSCKCESCRAGNTPLFLQPKHLDKSEKIILKKKKIKNAWLIEISSDFKLIDISEKYSIAKGDYNSPTIEEEKKFYFSVGYSINTDGNLYTFDNIVIGLDLTGVLYRLSQIEERGDMGFFIRFGRNNFYNHTELTVNGIGIFTGPDYALKTGFGYDYFLSRNICLNSKIYWRSIHGTTVGSTITSNSFNLMIQSVKKHQIALGIGLQIYLRKKSRQKN